MIVTAKTIYIKSSLVNGDHEIQVMATQNYICCIPLGSQ